MSIPRWLRRLMAAAAPIIAIAIPSRAETPSSGYVLTSFGGSPIVMPLLATYLASWELSVENQSILSLVDQGDASPSAIAAEAIAVAKDFCAATSAAPVPDCADPAGVAAPLAAKLSLEAGLVPAGQWSAASYDPHRPATLAMAAAAAPHSPPPAPPSTQPLVGACYTMQPSQAVLCTAGPGATLASPAPAGTVTIADRQFVAGASGVHYQAHVVGGLIGETLYFTPAP